MTEFIKCPFCGKISTITAPSHEFALHLSGVHAQDAFSRLSVTERETVISGLCADCQSLMFGTDDGNEESA